MVYTSERVTDSGKIKTFLVRGNGTSTFRIVSFRMSDDFAEKQHLRRVERTIEISVFDSYSMEWKVLVPSVVFSYGDCMDMQTEDSRLLDKVRDFMRDYFGIDFSW